MNGLEGDAQCVVGLDGAGGLTMALVCVGEGGEGGGEGGRWVWVGKG